MTRRSECMSATPCTEFRLGAVSHRLVWVSEETLYTLATSRNTAKWGFDRAGFPRKERLSKLEALVSALKSIRFVHLLKKGRFNQTPNVERLPYDPACKKEFHQRNNLHGPSHDRRPLYRLLPQIDSRRIQESKRAFPRRFHSFAKARSRHYGSQLLHYRGEI